MEANFDKASVLGWQRDRSIPAIQTSDNKYLYNYIHTQIQYI